MAIFLFLFNVDVQWLSGVPAEWSSPFSIVQCLMFKGSRVVSRMAIFFFVCVQCLTFNGCRAIKSCRMAISFIVQYWCRVSLVFFVIFFVLLLGKYLCCIVMFIFIYYLLTYLVFVNLQQYSKKGKSVTRAVCYFISHFGMNWVILR